MLEGPLVLMAVMLLQLGGVPNYLISKLGKGAWVAWMLLVRHNSRLPNNYPRKHKNKTREKTPAVIEFARIWWLVC